MINIQPIEKYTNDEGHVLDVRSVFHTIQGEGPLSGHPAIFVRLAGCNLQCPGCDTDYTNDRRTVSVEGLMQEVRIMHSGPRLVVITGGEPFRQNISLFCMLLLDEGYQVQIETNGSLPPSPGFPASSSFAEGAWIVCSPKTTKINRITRELAVAFKYPLSHDSVSEIDGLPIDVLNHTCSSVVARPREGFPVGAVYVTPADSNDADTNLKNLHAAMKTCMRYGYTLGVQLHKIINVE